MQRRHPSESIHCIMRNLAFDLTMAMQWVNENRCNTTRLHKVLLSKPMLYQWRPGLVSKSKSPNVDHWTAVGASSDAAILETVTMLRWWSWVVSMSHCSQTHACKKGLQTRANIQTPLYIDIIISFTTKVYQSRPHAIVWCRTWSNRNCWFMVTCIGRELNPISHTHTHTLFLSLSLSLSLSCFSALVNIGRPVCQVPASKR